MSDAVRRQPPGTVVACAVVVLIKAGLGLWGAYALLVASRTHHKSFLGSVVTHRQAGLGSVLLALSVLSIAAAVALLLVVPWARLYTLVLEGAGIVLGLARVASHPRSSFVSLAMSLAIIGLLLAPGSARAFGGSRSSVGA